MLPHIQLLPDALSEIFRTTTKTGLLAENDRYGLLAAALDESLAEEERRAINRLLRAVRRGRIRVIS
ncbi:MAG: hypothetical protein SW833_07800 [Cyanobacteriota bacterium]|nr:hypothetical protein [Cyanobacteriota bacterium]